MFIIVGLGNPGKEYEHTRHNAGFELINALAKEHNITMSSFDHHSIIGKGFIAGHKVLLVKPQTYMNLSGVAVSSILSFYKEEVDNLIILYDDIDLPVGKVRVRAKGSAGGHNGIKDIINQIGDTSFKRVRLGVGKKPDKWDLADWVLSRFTSEEDLDFDKGKERAIKATQCILEDGVGAAMNRFNA